MRSGVAVARGERGRERFDRRLVAAALGAAHRVEAGGENAGQQRDRDQGRQRDDQSGGRVVGVAGVDRKREDEGRAASG